MKDFIRSMLESFMHNRSKLTKIKMNNNKNNILKIWKKDSKLVRVWLRCLVDNKDKKTCFQLIKIIEMILKS